MKRKRQLAAFQRTSSQSRKQIRHKTLLRYNLRYTLIIQFVFEPKYQEFRSGTIWSLSNAFTSAFKELDQIPQFKATAKLGEFLEARFSQSFFKIMVLPRLYLPVHEFPHLHRVIVFGNVLSHRFVLFRARIASALGRHCVAGEGAK